MTGNCESAWLSEDSKTWHGETQTTEQKLQKDGQLTLEGCNQLLYAEDDSQEEIKHPWMCLECKNDVPY